MRAALKTVLKPLCWLIGHSLRVQYVRMWDIGPGKPYAYLHCVRCGLKRTVVSQQMTYRA
jgi:hypothetical protein